MIHDKFSTGGYEVHLVSGYEIRCINRNGHEMKNPPAAIKSHAKWKEFVRLRMIHRKRMTKMRQMMNRNLVVSEPIFPAKVLDKWNEKVVSDVNMVEMYDVFKVVENMYVLASWHEEGEAVSWQGFIDGVKGEKLLVDGKKCDEFYLLHPIEITNVAEVQIRAIKELRTQHIMQLFRPVYALEAQEEEVLRRFRGVAVRRSQLVAVSSNMGWITPVGLKKPIIRKDFGKYAIVLEYSIDYPHDQTCYEVGEAMFFNVCTEDNLAIHKLGKPVRAIDVPTKTMSEMIWETEKMLAPCRIDDVTSKEMTIYRQQMAKIYISAMCVDRAEVIGNSVKILGHYGRYGVSLVTGVSFWWSDKSYLCIQPKSYLTNSNSKDKGDTPAFALGEESLDPTLALAMAKVYQLAHDDEPVDAVVRNNTQPYGGNSQKGESLAGIELEYKEKLIRDAQKW